jgi:type VI protein secretion system component Hcp
MAYDAFMIIKVDRSNHIEGESDDARLSEEQAIEIQGFSFSPEGVSYEAEGTADTQPTDFKTTPTPTAPAPTPKNYVSLGPDVKDPAKTAMQTNWKNLEERIIALEKVHKGIHDRIDEVEKNVKGAVTQLNQKGEEIEKAVGEVAKDVEEVKAELEELTSEVQGKPGLGSSERKRLSLTVDKFVDLASPQLLHHYCQACEEKKSYTPLHEVLLLFRKAGRDTKEYLSISMLRAKITSYQLNVSSGTEPPRETVVFTFEEFKTAYAPQMETGRIQRKAVIMGWDYEKGVMK